MSALIRSSRWWPVAGALLAGALLGVYAWSVSSYRQGLDAMYEAPAPPPNAVAVRLVPYTVDAAQQFAATEVTVYPGADLLTPEGRLRREISVDLFGLRSSTVTFARGEVPSPVAVDIPAAGIVQDYPFDSYRWEVSARAVRERNTGTSGNPPVLAMSLSMFVKVPGWTYGPQTASDGYSTDTREVRGTFARDSQTVTIALIFITLIVMFGVLSVVAVAAAVRGRIEVSIGLAAWLTGAIFALVSLRNALPGQPPLGSWMDVLAYFWVIVVIMLMIGATVVLLVARRSGLAEPPHAPAAQQGVRLAEPAEDLRRER